MTVNIETDIDLNIKKVDEMLEKMKLLENKSNMIRFVTIKEFAKIRNCSLKIAQDIFNEQSFPSESYGKTKVAEISAIINWYQQKRDKKSSTKLPKK